MILVFLAEGFEEIEALTVVDYLRRVDLNVKTVAVGENYNIKGSHDIIVKADILEKDVKIDNNLTAVVLPGGLPGATNLEKSNCVNTALDFCYKNGKHIAAICAAPMIIGKKDFLINKKATCYPGFEKYLNGAIIENVKVVTDGNITTACGPGAASVFALELSKLFADNGKYKLLEESILCRD